MNVGFMGDFFFTYSNETEYDKNEKEVMKLMAKNYLFIEQFQVKNQYVTSGSILWCTGGSKLTKFDIPIDHAVDKDGKPLAITSDCKTNCNIYAFSGCNFGTPKGYPLRKTVIIDGTSMRINEKEICIPMLNEGSGWQKTESSYLRIKDLSNKKYYDAVTTGDYLVCFYGGYIRVVEVPGKIDSQDCVLTYLSDDYMKWLEIAEGCTLYPFKDSKDSAEAQARKNVTIGIGCTFDILQTHWDLVKDVTNWSDSDLRYIANSVYNNISFKKDPKYAITYDQAVELFKLNSFQYINNINNTIVAFNRQNGNITQYNQRELEAMFDYSYNNGVSAATINRKDKVIYYYLRKDLNGAVSAVRSANNMHRRRINQMNLFFNDYTFTEEVDNVKFQALLKKLGF